jgi:hypothetical protein
MSYTLRRVAAATVAVVTYKWLGTAAMFAVLVLFAIGELKAPSILRRLRAPRR